MTRDPIRWLADPAADPRLSELLSSADSPLGLSDAVMARIGSNLTHLASTGAALASADAGANAGAAAKAATVVTKSGIFASIGAKSVLIVGLLGAVGIGGAVAWSHAGRPASEASPIRGKSAASPTQGMNAASPTHAAEEASLANPARPVELATALVGTAVADLPLADGATERTPRTAASVASGAARPASNLAEEARLLERARSLMTTDLGAARRALAEYDSKFSAGALKQERALLSVKLAALAGNRVEAEDRAAQIENSGTPSPYAKRAREVANSVERSRATRTSNE